MADIINLNRYRKQKQQRERERRANEKRVRFGIPKSRARQRRGATACSKRAGWMAPAATSVAATATTEIADLQIPGPCVGRLHSRPREPTLRMSHPVKRSFTIGGHRTSISLEAPVLGCAERGCRPASGCRCRV